MRNLNLVLLAVFATAAVGCASAQSPVNGALYTDVKSGSGATEAYGGSARGESCAASYLGIVALGDATIDSAKKSGGIAQVTAVDHTAMSILGFYAKYCTVVYGKRAASGAPPAAAPAKPAG
jgi:hypothetical protein